MPVNYIEALKFALRLKGEDAETGRIVVLVPTKSQYSLPRTAFAMEDIKRIHVRRFEKPMGRTAGIIFISDILNRMPFLLHR